jgi:hypothetical protein
MTAWGWTARSIACLPLVAMLVAAGGCKSLNERYIALEVWKYERCFGHLPPGFVPPGAAAPAAPPPRVCGQGAACPQGCPPATAGCDNCQGQGAVMEGGMAMPPPGIGVPTGPGGSPGPGTGAGLPTPAGVTAGKPVIISDEVVLP